MTDQTLQTIVFIVTVLLFVLASNVGQAEDNKRTREEIIKELENKR